MGASQSSVVQSVTETLNQNITNIINRSAATAKTTSVSTNSFSMLNYGTIKNCGIQLTQKIGVNSTVAAIAGLNSESSIENLIKSAIAETVTQNQKSVQDFLATTFTAQESRQEMITKLQNIVQTNITQESVGDIMAMTTSINRGTFPNYGTIDCAGQQINVYQEIMVKQVAQATTNATTSAMNKNTQIADTVKKLEQKQAAESKGLTALVNALTGPFAIAAIAFIVFLLFGAKTGFSTLTDPKKVIKILIVIGIIVGVLFAIKFATKKKEPEPEQK